MNRLQKITTTILLSLVLVLLAFVHVQASDFVFNKTVVQIDNNATVDNTVHTYSNSGGNTTTTNGGNYNGNTNSGGATSIIQTGNAGAQTIICNDVNHTVINGNNPANCPSGVNPTPTPGPQPTATPIPGCTSNCGGGSNGGGSSSGNSSSGGSSSSSNGAVLGTMASTGTFTENLMNAIALIGIGFLSFGLIQKMKKITSTLQFEIRY